MTSRCDYDTIFQRISCITLVAIAFTFTIILTNVFVDIDGLLSKKDKVKNALDTDADGKNNIIKTEPVHNLIEPQTYNIEGMTSDEDNEDIYRSKRSLDTPNFLFQVKNPKIKNILTNRLNTLLEELDQEEYQQDKDKKEEKPDTKENTDNERVSTKDTLDDKRKNDNMLESILKAKNKIVSSQYRQELDDEMKEEETHEKEDMLHLAMHNILLQGIIGHMDLNDVYKKVHMLLRNFKPDNEAVKENKTQFPRLKIPKETGKMMESDHSPSLEENKFFDELIKCDKLQSEFRDPVKATVLKGSTKSTSNEPKILIKTVIDITSNKDIDRRVSVTNSNENVQGIVKLIYNGRPVKISKIDEEDKTVSKMKSETHTEIHEKQKAIDAIANTPERVSNKKSFFNKMIDDYFKGYPKRVGDEHNSPDTEDKYEIKRLKRQIKIKYEDDDMPSKNIETPHKQNLDDDELYVEIETHFDSKGMKGEKKKKIIRSIIDKIEKAIHSDLDNNKGKKKKGKHIQIKKRVQKPLDRNKQVLVNKIMIPLDAIVERHSDPISKTVPLEKPMPKVYDKSGESWKKSYHGPSFLAVSKSLNSAEMGEVDVDYNKVMAINGIPQRLQMPLNTDVSEELLNSNTFLDLGNLKFFIKNIDGTGLSLGFNQYTDEQPDSESMKLFTGIENLIKTYNKNNEYPNQNAASLNEGLTSKEKAHLLSKRDISALNRKRHSINQRSIKETRGKDYHSNEYKIIFDNDFLPYDSYQEIYEDKKNKVAYTIKKVTERPITDSAKTFNANSMAILNRNFGINKIPFDIFNEKLKPSEILSLASLLDRKKRFLSVKQISSLKNKIKLNRFINTRGITKKKFLLNKKRTKRQIDKIRIIATDAISRPRHSSENVFLVDEENMLADRAVIREVETPDATDTDNKVPAEHYEVVPYIYDDQTYTPNIFNGRSRQNLLMSKYPHIFLEEITRSTEDIEPFIRSNYNKKATIYNIDNNYPNARENRTVVFPENSPKIDDLVHALEPKQNYKLTVKIMPKNITDLNAGFKEVHTSINKSFNRGGLMFSSLLNVSEISKVEKLASMKSESTTVPTTVTILTESNYTKHIQEQQDTMNHFLKQHRKKIDEQLEHLKRERLNLDELAVKSIDEIKSARFKNHNSLSYFETTEEPISIPDSQFNKEEVSKLLSSLFKLKTSPTTTPIPKLTQKPTMVEPEKNEILNEIHQNEHVTKEILKQINRNTEMLQVFLQKITETIAKDHENLRQKNQEFRPVKFDYPKEWKPFQSLSETVYPPQIQYDNVKNNTHISIPFIYAYQQPYPSHEYKPNAPVASVVYHGHIHANSFSKEERRNITETLTNHINNETRYFIDTLENDYKVLPAKKIPLDGLNKNNTTI